MNSFIWRRGANRGEAGRTGSEIGESLLAILRRQLYRYRSILIVLFLFSHGFVRAQSQLIFPRLSFEQDSLIGVAVLNPTDSAADLTFTAYDESGQLIQAAGFMNPRQITIQPGQQYADVTQSLFGPLDSDPVAWFEATSPTSDLTGFFLYLQFPDFGFFDGADLPQVSKELLFPEVRLTEGFTTEIHLVNPGSEPATLDISLEGNDALLSANPLVLPARGVKRMDARELFAGVQASGELALPDPGLLRVVSSQPVAGFAFVKLPEGDLLGLNAMPADQPLNRIYFPQLAVGSVIRTELTLSNVSGADTLVNLTAHRPDGEMFGPSDVTQNPVSLALTAGEVRRLDLQETFGFVNEETRQGWLEVSSTSDAMLGALSYAIEGTGSLAGVATRRFGSHQAAFSHLATAEGFFTGLALLNPSSLAADVRIVAISQAGQILGTVTRTLAPGQRISELLGVDLIPQAAGQAGGIVYIRSSVPIFLTSLFGRLEGSGVLANIPAQPVPVSYRPDAGLPQARLIPPLAALEPKGNRMFQLQTVEGTPQWSVNGVPGGTPQAGMISADGLYQAPTAAPERLPATVTATLDDQEASASVDIVTRDVLGANLGVVQSLAYVEGLARLFVAELGVLGAANQAVPSGLVSVIVDVTTGEPQGVQQVAGEDISKILAYRDPNGKEYLLLAGRATGQIYRLALDPTQLRVIASGLNAPASMALDVQGDLLVAEADRLSRIPAQQLQAVGTAPQGDAPGSDLLLPEVMPRGAAVDPCSGAVYFSDGEEFSIQRLDRRTGNVTTVVTLTDPTQILGIPRAGVSCPDALNLLIAEPSPGQVTRVLPEQGQASLFALAPGVQDVAFLPPGNPFGKAGVLVLRQTDSGGEIDRFLVPGIYQTVTFNPPVHSSCIGHIMIADPGLEQGVREALGVGPSTTTSCLTAEGLTELVVQNHSVFILDGLEVFVSLDLLDLSFNQISDLSPLAPLTGLQTLYLSDNEISDLSPLAALTGLQKLGLFSNQVSDLSPLSQLINLVELDLYNNQVSDLSPLAQLTNLVDLFMEKNQVSDLSPLAQLTNLVHLFLSENQISDLSSLGQLAKLQELRLQSNQISNIAILAQLPELHSLDLRDNQISDISALVANLELGEEDEVLLSGNLLDAGDCSNINALVARGVSVDIAGSLCP